MCKAKNAEQKVQIIMNRARKLRQTKEKVPKKQKQKKHKYKNSNTKVDQTVHKIMHRAIKADQKAHKIMYRAKADEKVKKKSLTQTKKFTKSDMYTTKKGRTKSSQNHVSCITEGQKVHKIMIFGKRQPKNHYRAKRH